MGSSTEGLSESQLGDAIRAALDAGGDATAQIGAARVLLLDRVATTGAQGAAGGGRAGGIRGQASWFRFRLALGAAAVMAAGALIWLRMPISFRVGVDASAGPGRLGDVIQTAGAEPVTVRFSEGSLIVLSDGGRVRVLSAEATGARVLLEQGGADVAIVHRRARGTHWRFEAGPFRLLVTGTRFHVAWSPADESFAVATSEGAVQVSAPCLPAPATVRAGQRVRLSCAPPMTTPGDHRLIERPIDRTMPGAREGEQPPAPGGAPAVSASAATAAARTPAHSRQPAGPWRDLLAAGHLAEGLRAAEHAGFDRVCRIATLQELMALGDAARLAQHPARATTALAILRQRFPRSPDAATAAFTLGRIAYEKRAAYGEAERWFATYLDEQPSGPLMGDAAGRLMEAAAHGGAAARARGYAQRYLARFPEGPYAGQARALLGAPVAH